jgi:thiosulfate/3-mercaptopyruvate sulfurtransferase
LVRAEWVTELGARDGIVIVDPRRPMKYLAGHLPGAINVPAYKIFAADGTLHAPEALAEFFGTAGLSDEATPILYDSPEAQNAAMLAWALEYLGRTDVSIMESFYEQWKASGLEVRYRPVQLASRRLSIRLNPTIRMTAAEVSASAGVKFVDFRSREEFSGERVIAEDRPGHIPGALNVVWRELGNPPATILKSRPELEQLFAHAGVASGDQLVAYCRSGPRAALGYLALREAGYDVRLFDGSWAQYQKQLIG